MIRVGLVGEDPNDTSSIKNLLEKRYKDKALFFPLAKRLKGHQLDSQKIRNTLPLEFEAENCEFVIYVRDLDAFESQTDKVKAKIQWFKTLDALTNNNGILLLNIWELEALIFADIEVFNEVYNIQHRFSGNPMQVKDPKEVLKRLTRNLKKQYKESHSPDLFKKLNIDKVEANCGCFQDFVRELDSKLK